MIQALERALALAKGEHVDAELASRLSGLPSDVQEMIARRFELAAPYVTDRLKHLLEWLLTSREASNYTYDLTDRNLDQLAWFVAAVCDTTHGTAMTYILEILDDTCIQEVVATVTRSSSRQHVADEVARLGRRVGWYAIARIIKPRLVVETGTEKGLGAITLASALLRNRDDGYEGALWTIDVDETAGEYIVNDYAKVTTRITANSVRFLRGAKAKVDLFIHDSDHDIAYEADELAAVAPHLNYRSIVLSDNAHYSGALSHFSLRHCRRYLFFREEPARHFYPGAGIGASF